MKDLSIIIPSKNEPYLKKTVDDIRKHVETNIEILVGDDAKVNIGQRAMMNKLAKQATGKYIAKCDAHCGFAQGFDKIMLEQMEDDITMTAMMAMLDVKDWRIIPKPITSSYLFDTELRFQYDAELHEGNETMALQGSFYLLTRKKYFELNVCDERLGSWGFQGVETALKTWMSGGRVICNKDTFYGHYFRNRIDGGEHRYTGEEAKKVQDKMKKMFPKKDIKWLIEKFNYPCNWRKDNFKEKIL